MTKFDSIITDLCEANALPVQNSATAATTTTNQQPTTTTAQQKPATTPIPSAANKPAQPDFNKLMTDFNNPAVKINNVKDLEKYGLTVAVK